MALLLNRTSMARFWLNGHQLFKIVQLTGDKIEK